MTSRIFIYVLFIFLSALPAYAVTNTFRISTFISSDTTPPTTVTLTSLLPVSTTQIDLVWSASTDNFMLSGYQVFRNGTQIATTTLTSYSDTALTQSTLYIYHIRAFDSVFNYSSSSNSLATTTLAPVVVATSTSGSGTTYGSRALGLDTFSVVPGVNFAYFNFDTSGYTRFELRWGRTSSYELGFIASNIFKKTHKTKITDLDPGTLYQFELVGYTESGRAVVLKDGTFRTLPSKEVQAPANVQNLTAYLEGGRVLLSWKNPEEPSFAGVRVMRSHLFFPQSRSDGFVVFDGKRESTTDISAFARTHTEYYTVFAYDGSGNYSSGAIVAVQKNVTTEDTQNKDIFTVSTSTQRGVLTFDDVEFFQDTQRVDATKLVAGVPVFVRIAYEKLPEHLKTITLTLSSEAMAPQSYLLRINSDTTYYEAKLKGEENPEMFSARITVYDFETKKMYGVEGTVAFVGSRRGYDAVLAPLVATLAVPSEVATFIFFVFVFFLIGFIYVCWKRFSRRSV
jgi:hypothetical protein